MIDIAEYIGIIAFSVSGFYIGRRADLDILGIYIVSFLTALGGGISRDIIIGRPPISMTQTAPVLIVIFITTLLIFIKRYRQSNLMDKFIFVFVDAIGMSSFAVSGAILAIQQHFNIVGVSIIAFLTAIGGGILRDILINEVPYVLKGGFYGVIALGIGAFSYILAQIDILHSIFITILFAVSIIVRMYAYKNDWHLPKVSDD